MNRIANWILFFRSISVGYTRQTSYMRSSQANAAFINASNPNRYETVGVFFCFYVGFHAGFFPFLRYLFVHVDVVFHVVKRKKTL